MRFRGDVLSTTNLTPTQRRYLIASAGTLAGALVFGGCASNTKTESPGPQPTSISQEDPKQETAPAAESQEQPSTSLMDFQPLPELVELTGIQNNPQALEYLEVNSDFMLRPESEDYRGLYIYKFWKALSEGDYSVLADYQITADDIDEALKYHKKYLNLGNKLGIWDLNPEILQQLKDVASVYVTNDANTTRALIYFLEAFKTDAEAQQGLVNKDEVVCPEPFTFEDKMGSSNPFEAVADHSAKINILPITNRGSYAAVMECDGGDVHSNAFNVYLASEQSGTLSDPEILLAQLDQSGITIPPDIRQTFGDFSKEWEKFWLKKPAS